MHKVLPANETAVLYKIEENGKTIENLNILKIAADNSVTRVTGVTIQSGNYIRLTAPITGGATILVMYDLKETKTEIEIVKDLQQQVAILKEALKKRITIEELNLYVEKLKQFNS